MIDLEFIEKLIRTLDESSLDHVEIEKGGTRIRVSKTPPGPPSVASSSGGTGSATTASAPAGNPPAPSDAPAAAPAEDAPPAHDPNLLEITSPMVGTFYRSPAPNAEPFVEVGRTIAKGDPLCIIEAMKLMNELEAEVEGTIREICVENAEPVEYGQVLFRIQPA